ncbi:MAG TPA: hypothetical protein PLC81_03415, partial [Bacteroidales bacterium]|nr:hypothetical protein [Bacteroidales bacterium]
MRTPLSIMLIMTAVLTACSAGFQTTGTVTDDIYYSPKDRAVVASAPVPASTAQVSQPDRENNAGENQTMSDYERYRLAKEQQLYASDTTAASGQQEYYSSREEGENYQSDYVPDDRNKSVVINNYYDYDPYDYYYTSRIRRFHSSYYWGWGYYDPFFTDLYWYTYNPWDWGIS